MITHDHKREVEILRGQLAALRRQQVRSAEMATDIISAFGETFRRTQRLSEEGADAGMRFTDSAVVFPLGVKDQHVVLGPSDAIRSVSATAFMKVIAPFMSVAITASPMLDNVPRSHSRCWRASW